MENILNTMLIPFVKSLALAIIVLIVGLAVIRKISDMDRLHLVGQIS